MKPGKVNLFFLLIFINFFEPANTEEKIISVPLINLENLKPSFEKEEMESKDILEKESISLKEKKNIKKESKIVKVNIVALDKITAKTSNINLLLGEKKKFGFLEIKAIKCGNIKSQTEQGQAVYIQVKDLSENTNDKIFVFNGWTFSSSTTLNPLDHPIYDFWLIGCENV